MPNSMIYSGRTTCYEHKRGDWEKTPGAGAECIQQHTIFDVQWTNCPVEVEDEVKRLWLNVEYGNDNYYFTWDDEENAEDYPVIAKYLRGKGVTKCLIHWWW